MTLEMLDDISPFPQRFSDWKRARGVAAQLYERARHREQRGFPAQDDPARLRECARSVSAISRILRAAEEQPNSVWMSVHVIGNRIIVAQRAGAITGVATYALDPVDAGNLVEDFVAEMLR